MVGVGVGWGGGDQACRGRDETEREETVRLWAGCLQALCRLFTGWNRLCLGCPQALVGCLQAVCRLFTDWSMLFTGFTLTGYMQAAYRLCAGCYRLGQAVYRLKQAECMLSTGFCRLCTGCAGLVQSGSLMSRTLSLWWHTCAYNLLH